MLEDKLRDLGKEEPNGDEVGGMEKLPFVFFSILSIVII